MTDPTPAAGGLTEREREALVRSWPWPQEAATTAEGFNDVTAVVERIIAARTEAADREVARVTAAVEALADEWERIAGDNPGGIDLVRQLRSALSSAGTGALDRERAKAWDEGYHAWAVTVTANPYRAAAVSPEGGGE